MKLIAALSTLGIVASAAASGNGHHSLRHDRSLQVAPATCLVNGIKIDAGEKYIASDGCNTW